MEITTKKAVDLFENKYNCAQSVLTAFGPQFELEPEITLKIACGFGAGMGRLQETCGAVTGAFMVIGLKNGQESKEDTEAKEKTYELVKEFSSRFKQIHGSLNCKDIINCDINTPEGNQYYEENNLHQKCKSCVEDSVTILNSILK